MRALRSSPREQRRLVVGLTSSTVLLWLGASSILPLLPEYLREHGSRPLLVGVIMSAYFAASVCTQIPVGRLADRIGTAPVLVGGLVVFALGSCGFALSTGPIGAVAFRALQGVGAGAVIVASAATIGARVELESQGRAFGALYGGQMLALAVGPLLGTVFGLRAMRELFLVAGIVALGAIAPVLGVSRQPAGDAGSGAVATPGRLAELEAVASGAPDALSARRARRGLQRSPELLGVALCFGAGGILVGVYESSWTLLLELRHASVFDIGLSWTLFALPFAVLAVPAGRLAERVDRRVLVYASLGSSAGFAFAYPYLHLVALLVGLGCVEAAGAVIGAPAAVLVLTESTSPAFHGQAQGTVETARTAATALAAAGSGALFGLDPVYPFVIGAGLVVVMTGVIVVLWRAVPGHLAERARPTQTSVGT